MIRRPDKIDEHAGVSEIGENRRTTANNDEKRRKTTMIRRLDKISEHAEVSEIVENRRKVEK